MVRLIWRKEGYELRNKGRDIKDARDSWLDNWRKDRNIVVDVDNRVEHPPVEI